MMKGFEPYAWKLVLTGEREADGVPYTAIECGPDAYENAHVREAVEEQGRTAFAHMHPGAVVASVRWYPLHNFGGDDE